MTRKMVEKIIKEMAERLNHGLWLRHWVVAIKLDRLDGDTAATCNLEDLDYRRAYIVIDPEKFDDEDGEKRLRQTLTHEYVHVALSEYDHYRRMVIAMMPEEHFKLVEDAEHAAWTHAIERTTEGLVHGPLAYLWKGEKK